MRHIFKQLTKAILGGLALPVLAFAAASQEVEIAEDLQLSDQGQIVLQINPNVAVALPAKSSAQQSILIDFNELETKEVPSTYYEVYLVSQNNQGVSGHYVGNLTFFGVSEMSTQNAPSQSIDITQAYNELDFKSSGVGIMLRAASPDSAKPKIGSVDMRLVNN